jgi:hypothetical protein
MTSEPKRVSYTCNLTVNGRNLTDLEISFHLGKHPDITYELVLELAKSLDGKNFPVEAVKDSWEYFVEKNIPRHGKKYKLVWCWPKDNTSFLVVRTCHRQKKYEKKK